MDRERIFDFLRNAAIALAILIPGPLVVRLILKNAVNVPFDDEWAWALDLIHYHDHTLSLGDLWQAHNGHRIFFPSLIALGLAIAFGWNITFESVLGVALLVLVQIPLFRMTRATLGKNWGAVVFVAGSGILFSLGQIENYLWGFQLAWFLIVFCLFYTIDLLRVKTMTPVPAFLATLLCIVAAYSSAFGLIVPAVAVFVVFSRRRLVLDHVAVWLGLCAVLAYFYLHGLDVATNAVSKTAPVPLADRIAYIGTYLGSPLAGWAGEDASRQVGLAGVLWLAICAAILIFSVRDAAARERWTPWFAIAGFTVMSAAMTAYGRAGLGMARSSRYTTLGDDFWISLIPLTVLAIGMAVQRAPAAVRQYAPLMALPVCAAILYGISLQSTVGYTTALTTIPTRYPALLSLDDPAANNDAAILPIFPDVPFTRSTVRELSADGYWPLR